ncbi:MAG: PTS system mannose/fructose/sorbose family transporter subunit IID [Longimicrobiales bacterium]|nr:PTS system mannose/fructose/sorbose family transporter subunit IID [Longimicrobiales bacterium]
MIGAGVQAAVVLRALAIQGSWNYETLTGTGFGFAILPALRALHTDPEALDAAIRRHERAFNSHPYLAPLALGAVIHMEAAGEDPAVIDRFKAALRGSLGTLGDQLVWAGVRPLCLLLALALILLGASWWAAIVVFLCLYNAVHLGLMVWGFRVGLAEGRGVAERLRQTPLSRLRPQIMAAGAFMAGLVIALVVTRGVAAVGEPGPVWTGLALIGVVGGAVWGRNARRAGVAAMMALALVGLLAGALG